MIKNEKGEIALVYYQPIDQAVRIDGITYYFVTKRAVSLAWVIEEHINAVFSITKSCCNNQKHTVYRYATPSQVNVWSGTGR